MTNQEQYKMVRRARHYIDNGADFYALHVDFTQRKGYSMRQMADLNRLQRQHNAPAYTVIMSRQDFRWLFDNCRNEFFTMDESGLYRWAGTDALRLENLIIAHKWMRIWHAVKWDKRTGVRYITHETEITNYLTVTHFCGDTYIRTGSKKTTAHGGYSPDITGINTRIMIECKGKDGRLTGKALEGWEDKE